MPGPHPRRTAPVPESVEWLLVGLAKLALVLAVVAIFLLPFRAVSTLTATLSTLAVFIVASAAIAAVLRSRAD